MNIVLYVALDLCFADTSARDAQDFRKLLDSEWTKLNEQSQIWECKLDAELIEKLPEDVDGQIRAIIGKARLLMNKKGRFEQFSSLIDDCEFERGEKRTTCMDLQVHISWYLVGLL